MGKTKIDWCDESLNFFTGCSKGCTFCYARKMAARLGGVDGTGYAAVKAACGDPFRPAYHEHLMKKALERLKRATPRRIFLGSMSDIGHSGNWLFFDGTDRAPGKQISTSQWVQDMVRWFCGELPQHQFIILTKRPATLPSDFPINVHVGVSVTANHDDARIDELRVWRSMEYLRMERNALCGNPVGKGPGLLVASVEPLMDPDFNPRRLHGFEWVIVGAQTGPGAGLGKPYRQEDIGDDQIIPITFGEVIAHAAERIVEWCERHKVPCFVKDNIRRIELESRPPMDWPREFPRVLKAKGD